MRLIVHLLSLFVVIQILPFMELNAEPIVTIEQLSTELKQSHPRLFADADGFEQLRQKIAAPENAVRFEWFSKFIIQRADELLDAPALVYEKDESGRRILHVSRDFIRRATHLGMAYQLTGESVYRDGAIEVALTVCAFPDWNPAHFLDPSEMVVGVAITYDWLYDELTDAQRSRMRQSICDKALRPSLEPHRWFRDVHHNWNQVCNGGLTMAAIAVMEDEPALAAQIIQMAIETIPLATEQYEPNGCYPEGPTYWCYGTQYNLLMCAALDAAYGTDFGILRDSALAQSPLVIQHLTGPSGKTFNYSDNHTKVQSCPGVLWLANFLGNPGIAALEEQKMRALYDGGDSLDVRFLPLRLLWMAAQAPALPEMTPLSFQDLGGRNPVAVHRSSWTDPDALFVAIKAGSPSINHGHMDTGTFVLEAKGVCWAIDLGKEEYAEVELFKDQVSLWDNKQEGTRWDIFRNGPLSHNILLIDAQRQSIDGHATLEAFADREDYRSSVVDLSSLYANQVDHYTRRVSIVDQSFFEIEDEVKGAAYDKTIRWAMLTEADVAHVEGNRILLKQDGQQLELSFELEGTTAPLAWTVYSTNEHPPLQVWDSPNPGTRMIGFEASSREALIRIRVIARPQ